MTFHMGNKKRWMPPRLILVLQILAFLLPIHALGRDFFGIVDYRPSVFVEQPNSPFFFSIGKKLKFGTTISESAPTLFEGDFFNSDIPAVYPSPDEAKAAIVSGGKLYIAEAGRTTILLLSYLDSLSATKLQPGDIFYKFPTIQWDAGSRAIYIVRDKKQKELANQGFSRDAVLVRLDMGDPKTITEVVPDFRSISYFLVGDSAVCFNYASGNGTVIWKCSHDRITEVAKSIEDNGIILADGTSIAGKPFLSYNGSIYESEIWLTRHGFSLKETTGGYVQFLSASRPDMPIFTIKGGHNIKGHFTDGILQRGCVVLPGGRYALLDVYHDNFAGQLLVDGLTGQYRELPRRTRAYRNLNSSIYENVKIGFHWFDSNKFMPAAELRTSSKSGK